MSYPDAFGNRQDLAASEAEAVLVKLAPKTPAIQLEAFTKWLERIGGVVLSALPGTPSFLAMLTPEQSERVKGHPSVTHLGGVTLAGRGVTRLRVPADGSVRYKVVYNNIVRVESG